MSPRTHRVQPHRSAIAGIEALALFSDHRFPRHSHDQYGIGVMTAGAQKSWSVIGHVESQAGDVIMVNPGEMHDGVPLGAARGWRIIYVDPAVVARELAAEGVHPEPVMRPVARDAALARGVARLFGRLGARDPLAAEEALMACLMRVVDRHVVSGPRPPRSSPAVTKAVRRLDAAPQLPISLGELAALCGVNRFQLLRGFAREVGTTPHAYLVQRRARLARRLVSAGIAPADAALQAGFADQSHLTRAFVRHFGITPGRLRAALEMA